MRARTLHTAGEQRTIAVILATGDEAVACLMQLAAQEGITVAQFTAIGGFSSAVLGYFDWQTKEYRRNPVDEQVEVASLTGDIAEGEDGTPSLHIHCVLGRRDGTALAGHLIEGNVRPTLEVVLIESPAHLRKRHDRESGLALIDPRA
jgi:predicted DNA-binding protein with PD1-like motif